MKKWRLMGVVALFALVLGCAEEPLPGSELTVVATFIQDQLGDATGQIIAFEGLTITAVEVTGAIRRNDPLLDMRKL